MNSKLIPLAAAAFVAASGFGSAQTFAPGTGPNTYHSIEDYGIGDAGSGSDVLTFTNNTGSGENPYGADRVSLKETILTFDDGSTQTVFDICAELFNGPTGTSTYAVTEGFGAGLSSVEGSLRALFSNALPLLLAETTYADRSLYGAAIQLAFWEIAEDGSSFSLNDGNLFVSSRESSIDGAIDLANTWLSDINSGIWSDKGGLTYYFADAEIEQDRLWIAVPEPSTALLGGLGALFLLRRRRN